MRSRRYSARLTGIALAALTVFALELAASPVEAVQYIPQNGQYVPQQQRYQQPGSSAAYANCANAAQRQSGYAGPGQSGGGALEGAAVGAMTGAMIGGWNGNAGEGAGWGAA
ncbi:MAG: hypothetical protein JO009_09625, partial [Candidatus Eremiobacteraeota bacterium]|nr:hypothetical protein [Candidatus Eremiobacteraeota bacterium]